MPPDVYAQQFADLAELAGGFIHEIKNHLNTLSLNLQLLAEDFENPETQRERRALDRMTRLHGECRRLADLSNDFLRFAKVEDLERTPIALDDVIGRMIDFFGPTAKERKIEVVWYPAPDLPPLSLDREMFEKALLNLMLNAEDAMPDGGMLTVQARAEGDSVVLEVIDTGCGIPADLLPRLFKPFVTTKPGGNGLGLATTRKVIAAHGGTIDVQSEPGRGSKFTVRLPVN
jgi:two-component system, NtrC family, sensor histidine kinase HydH